MWKRTVGFEWFPSCHGNNVHWYPVCQTLQTININIHDDCKIWWFPLPKLTDIISYMYMYMLGVIWQCNRVLVCLSHSVIYVYFVHVCCFTRCVQWRNMTILRYFHKSTLTSLKPANILKRLQTVAQDGIHVIDLESEICLHIELKHGEGISV